MKYPQKKYPDMASLVREYPTRYYSTVQHANGRVRVYDAMGELVTIDEDDSLLQVAGIRAGVVGVPACGDEDAS